MDTLALAIGTNVRLVTTRPLSEPLPVDGPDGDVTEPLLPLQANAARSSSDVHKRLSIVVYIYHWTSVAGTIEQQPARRLEGWSSFSQVLRKEV
jgi:hypothetical protein